MSLILVKEPIVTKLQKAKDLNIGTWFLDRDGQIYVVVLDDRTHEKRVLCVGNFYKPFIVNIPLEKFEVKKILQIGTMLQISSTTEDGGGHV